MGIIDADGHGAGVDGDQLAGQFLLLLDRFVIGIGGGGIIGRVLVLVLLFLGQHIGRSQGWPTLRAARRNPPPGRNATWSTPCLIFQISSRQRLMINHSLILDPGFREKFREIKETPEQALLFRKLAGMNDSASEEDRRIVQEIAGGSARRRSCAVPSWSKRAGMHLLERGRQRGVNDLAMVRLRIGQLRALAGSGTRCAAGCPTEADRAMLARLHDELQPVCECRWSRRHRCACLRGALRDLVEAMESFNAPLAALARRGRSDGRQQGARITIATICWRRNALWAPRRWPGATSSCCRRSRGAMWKRNCRCWVAASCGTLTLSRRDRFGSL